jgi:hypothetical protein
MLDMGLLSVAIVVVKKRHTIEGLNNPLKCITSKNSLIVLQYQ